MAYTTYPDEAGKFAFKSTELSERLTETESNIRELETIFKIDEDEDYLKEKKLGATEELLSKISIGKDLLNSEVTLVKGKADELEREAELEAKEKEAARLKDEEEQSKQINA